MATRYVDVDADVGGNGTTNGLTGGTCAYKSLNIWEAARQADLTSAEPEVCICESSHASHTADTTAVTIVGWTTVAANYIEVKTSTAARHAGVWSDSKYRLLVSNAHALNVQEDYVRVDGLQVGKSGANGNLQTTVNVNTQTASANDIRLSNLISKQVGGDDTYSQPGIYINDADTIVTIWNCIAYGSVTNSTKSDSSQIILQNCATANIYSCTAIGGYYGIRRVGGTVTAKNCYGYGNSAGFSAGITTSYCASNTTELSGTGDVDSVLYTTANFESVTPGEATYLKVKSGGGLHEAGTTLSDDPPGSTALSVDIAGNARS